uniref:Putative ovule protein n=1 Tax=Solanum chacoense TaxID=4108 RepID=A0A0V0HHJ5_SOLCH
MLLLDGCFVVEFIRGEDIIINIDDCIYNQIFRDLMLLENQLPLFILNKLHDMTKQVDELPLAILLNNSSFFTNNLPPMFCASYRETKYNAENIKHLLHAVHIFSCHGQNPMKNSKK